MSDQHTREKVSEKRKKKFNPVAKELRKNKFRLRKVENKKKLYSRNKVNLNEELNNETD
ncbi:MAG: hypothetical protein KDD45_14810 [Bdellovibrionales bacterium]|nr:hypothetical protein [Bdellovibrionales bacterium]